MTASRIAELEAALPDLPQAHVTYADHSYPAYSAAQMKAYAIAALSAPAAPESAAGDTGNAEADRTIDRLMSSDPDFEDCSDAALLIRKLVIEHKGPEGFATWKDAAMAERVANKARNQGDASQFPETASRVKAFPAASPPPAALGVEEVARAIDPEAWSDNLPIPTRADTVAFHERRQASCATASRVLALLPQPEPEGARSISAETVKIIWREMGSALFDELVSRGVDAELIMQAVEACADRSEAEVAAIRAKEEGL